MSVIKGSVGRHGSNRRNDVLLVQQLMNDNLSRLGPREKLIVDGVSGAMLVQDIIDYQIQILHSHAPNGRVDPSSMTLRSLLYWSSASAYLADSVRAIQAIQSDAAGPIAPVDQVAPGGGKNQKFTDDPNEVRKVTTVPGMRVLVDSLKVAWPELTVDGKHLLAAQSMGETGDERHCYNWNFGNKKSPDKANPHMYLYGVWEAVSVAEGARLAARGKAKIASAETIAKHGWSCGAGQSIVVFQPPSMQSRFRAYLTMGDGVEDWMAGVKLIVKKQGSNFMEAINKGDCAEYARVLKLHNYYTGKESDYANNMRAAKKWIDLELGMEP